METGKVTKQAGINAHFWREGALPTILVVAAIAAAGLLAIVVPWLYEHFVLASPVSAGSLGMATERELTPTEKQVLDLCERKYGKGNMDHIWFRKNGEAVLTIRGENERWVNITNYSRWLREGTMTIEQIREML